MKEVYTDRHEFVTVSDEAYASIQEILATGQVCRHCRDAYDEINPKVSKNLCMMCFLDKQRHQGQYGRLEYIGTYVNETEFSSYRYYQFLDREGHIVVSDPTSESVSEDIYRTILYWGFHFPDDEKPYERYNWRIYGNITTDQAIVIEYTPRSYEQIKETAFLVYKDRAALELNKRRGDIRKLFAKARETIEATKDEKGYYHPYKDAGEWISQLYDSHLYRVIASQEHARLSSELLHV
jgi:hypothetical protein